MNVNEDEFPEDFKETIRKLQKAIVDDDIQNTMNIEDEIIEEIKNREREIKNFKEKVGQNLKALNEKDQALNEKDLEIERLKKLLGK